MRWDFLAVAVIVIVGLGLVLNSYFYKQPTQMADDSGATPEGIDAVVKANNRFAFDFYSNIKDKQENKEKNIFFSPYSISTALAMTCEGARGKTAEEMQSVFHFPKDDNVRRSSFAAVYNKLNPVNAGYKLSTANSLWVQQDYPFLSEYLTAVEKYYAGKATNVDFVHKTEETRQTINKWVEDETNNKIKDLIPQGTLDAATRLVLTNAIYFKGTWVKQFEKSETSEADFKVSEEKTVRVQMMSRTDDKSLFNYAETDDLQILEMMYKGEKISMIVLLPKNNMSSVENLINSEKLTEWRGMLKEERVNVYMPKFTFTTKYDLNENLIEMGMPSAFSFGAADFSGMDGSKSLFISKVLHQAFIDVNEQGTEAAAATAVIVTMGISLHPTFNADHPFIFLIQDRETGNILFMGRVVDPTQ